jgi:hypothetical protein
MPTTRAVKLKAPFVFARYATPIAYRQGAKRHDGADQDRGRYRALSRMRPQPNFQWRNASTMRPP